jgi:hypothetical protein
VVADLFSNESDDFFSTPFNRAVVTWLDKLGHGHRDAAKQHETDPAHPERYSYFWPYVVADANYIVFIIKFSHINRRHPASQDGWAMMQTERLFYISPSDL